MSPSIHDLKVSNVVVEWIAVDVVNEMAFWNWPMIINPDLPMQRERRLFPFVMSPKINTQLSVLRQRVPVVFLASVNDRFSCRCSDEFHMYNVSLSDMLASRFSPSGVITGWSSVPTSPRLQMTGFTLLKVSFTRRGPSRVTTMSPTLNVSMPTSPSGVRIRVPATKQSSS